MQAICGNLRNLWITLLVRVPVVVVMTLVAGWCALALWFAPLPWFISVTALVLFCLAMLVLLVFVRPYRRMVVCLAGLCALVIVCWHVQQPSNNRDWQPDVATLAYADIVGDTVTVHNIRNCDYHSETNYVVRHYDKTVLVSDLRNVDLYLVNWGIPAVSHVMMSFNFGTGDFICVSIETRKRTGQSYSMLRGFFRNYELFYVVADERDVVRLRTNYRQGENVCLYRTKPVSIQVARNIFLDYMRTVNELHETPQWYNALMSNCMVDAFRHCTPYGPKAKWHWSVIANGYFDQTMYRVGAIATNMPFAEIKARCLVNEKARAADKDPAFSLRIREGVPGCP